MTAEKEMGYHAEIKAVVNIVGILMAGRLKRLGEALVAAWKIYQVRPVEPDSLNLK